MKNNQPNQTIETMVQQFCTTTGRLKAMLGTKKVIFNNDKNLISFDFKMCRKANNCTLFYDYASDTYTMEFHRLTTKFQDFKKDVFTNLFFDELKSTFENYTGLYISLWGVFFLYFS